MNSRHVKMMQMKRIVAIHLGNNSFLVVIVDIYPVRSHNLNVKRLYLELTNKEFNIPIRTEAYPQFESWGALRKS